MRGSQEPGGLVLIVEDNRNISEMVGEYLESRGFEVDYAADGTPLPERTLDAQDALWSRVKDAERADGG